MYALLIGCHELERIGGSHTNIEEDSLSTIQWASWKTNYPWRIADWVKVVQDIFRKMGASFHHILREANSRADGLARKGVSQPSILFDVQILLVFWFSLYFGGCFVCTLFFW